MEKEKIKDYYVEELLVKIFNKGKQVYESPDVMDIKAFAKNKLKDFGLKF